MVLNEEGSTTSQIASYILATVPDTPAVAPSLVTSSSDSDTLVISVTEFTTGMNGGTAVIGYEIQVDDGEGGDFVTVQGGESQRTLATQVTVTDGIKKGVTYRVRYRAVNSIGTSDWSAVAYLTAATVPLPPPAPYVSSVDNTNVVLTLLETENNGGSTISNYELYCNEGADGSAFHKITAYSGGASTYTVNVGDSIGGHTIAVGNIYTFKYVAINAIGSSEDSDQIQVAIARAPTTPAAPTFNSELSNRTVNRIEWVAGTSLDSPVTGYHLYSDLGLDGDYFLIYDGDGNTNKLYYSHEGLSPGQPTSTNWRFSTSMGLLPFPLWLLEWPAMSLLDSLPFTWLM